MGWVACTLIGLLMATEARADAVQPAEAVLTNGVFSAYFNMTGQNVGGGTPPQVYGGTWSAALSSGGATGSGDITYLNNGNQLSTNFNFFDVRIYNPVTNPDGTTGWTTTDYSDRPVGAINLAPYLTESRVIVDNSDPAHPLSYFENQWQVTDPAGQPTLTITQDVGIIGTTLGDSAIYEQFSLSNPGSSGPLYVGLRDTRDMKLGSDDAPQSQIQTVTYDQCGNATSTTIGPTTPTTNQFVYAPTAADGPTVANFFSAAGGGGPVDITLGFDPSSNPLIGIQNQWGVPTTLPDKYAFADSQSANRISNAFNYSSNVNPVANGSPSDLDQGYDSAGLFWWGSTASTAYVLQANDGNTAVFNQAIFTPVPEPSAIGLALLVGSSLLVRRRRRT